jgi:hypothetical protein
VPLQIKDFFRGSPARLASQFPTYCAFHRIKKRGSLLLEFVPL